MRSTQIHPQPGKAESVHQARLADHATHRLVLNPFRLQLFQQFNLKHGGGMTDEDRLGLGVAQLLGLLWAKFYLGIIPI